MAFRRKKDWEALLEELKLLLASLEIDFRETKRIRSDGALCVIKGKKVIILKRNIENEDKAEIIKREMKQFDLEAKYIKPEVRDYLEE
jgi:hypothetical protein